MTKPKVAESVPIQVYLAIGERSRLDRLAAQLNATKSDIIRRGLAALEREVLDPSRHPALAMIGMAAAELSDDGHDAARDHDQLLVDDEAASWAARRPAKRAKRGAPRGG